MEFFASNIRNPAHASRLCPGRDGIFGLERSSWLGVDHRREAVACCRVNRRQDPLPGRADCQTASGGDPAFVRLAGDRIAV